MSVVVVPEVERACEVGASLADRLQNRSAQIRTGFLERPERSESLPMAVRLHRARGSPSLKLALSLLWAAGGDGVDERRSGDKYIARFAAADWADLLGMSGALSNDRRRISAALQRIEAEDVIERSPSPGGPTVVRLKNETGSGDEYRPPGGPRKDSKAEGNYLKLGPAFWTNGWMAALSNNAILAWLVLRLLDDRGKAGDARFLSPNLRESRFGFSADTWYAGVDELSRYGLIRKTTRSIRRPFDPDHPRTRDAYFLEHGRLVQRP